MRYRSQSREMNGALHQTALPTHDIGEFPNSENLDEYNGAMSNGAYYYFATETYPFFPRCFLGTVSDDFLGRP